MMMMMMMMMTSVVIDRDDDGRVAELYVKLTTSIVTCVKHFSTIVPILPI